MTLTALNEALQWLALIGLGVVAWIAITGFRERLEGSRGDTLPTFLDDGK